MSKSLIVSLWCALVLLQSCSRVTYEKFHEINNGTFKIMVRTREFNNSGSYNVDICVSNASSHGFPSDGSQCFFSGYEFDGLTVKWRSPRAIEVYFTSGRVSYFTNSAFVYPRGPVPEEFHIFLCDGCSAGTAVPLSGHKNT